MIITFSKENACKVLKNYIEALESNCPEDLMTYTRKLQKEFSSVHESVVTVYQRLKNAANAHIYNQIIAHPDRKIELKDGVAHQDPLILKVRVENSSYRKFFYQVKPENDSFFKRKEWTGDFKNITNIRIFDINNHKYKP